MKLNKSEKLLLKKYLGSIIVCVCSFIADNEIKIYIDKSATFPELLLYISQSLKKKEVDGWNGEDLREDQLNVLTIISELYLKRNKSKYKTIEKPSEILFWFSSLLKMSLSRCATRIRVKNALD